MSAIYVVITAVRGSAPRDAGTAMMVTPERTHGTIGGGALEYRAIDQARRLLAQGREGEETLPLGPGLGQCCGGTVRLRYTFAPQPVDTGLETPVRPRHCPPHPVPLWLWGAGHVGRACVRLADRQAFDITWVDTTQDRFPKHIPKSVRVVPAADLPRLALRADRLADHLIFTYSHDIDLALCAALLQRGARSVGLIGSETKKARFSKRLAAMGLDPSRITCPIGDKAKGKHPDAIAKSTLERLLRQNEVPA